MTNDIRDRMGGFKLTRGSLVIAVERWLKDLAVDYAKMDEVSRHKEAEIYVDEFLAAPSPCACGGKEPFVKLGGIDLVYNPDDERHWMTVGVLLEVGKEDINDCDVLVLPKGAITWGSDLPGGKPCS